MADINFKCPPCGKSLVIDAKGAGRMVKCPDCGISRVPLGIARHRARCSKRFERHLFKLARTMPISEVAAETGVHWETVKAAEIRHILGLLRKRDSTRCRRRRGIAT